MSLVLIIEDETMLRESLARGVSKLEGVEVVDAGDVDAALGLIDQRVPDLVISDIDLPGRSGLELLGELGRRRLTIPVIYVSAYLKAYGAQIPPNANISVMEKPVSLQEIREKVLSAVAKPEVPPEPFSVPDFVQLAGMGRRSVAIEASWADGSVGEIVVVDGEVWTAVAGDLDPLDAFARVAWSPGSRVRCRTLTTAPSARTLEGTAESILMDSARRLDESVRGDSYERAQRYSSTPPATESGELPDFFSAAADEFERASGEETFEGVGHDPEPEEILLELSAEQIEFQRHLDAGIGALLIRDYPAAVQAFESASALVPDDPIVSTNLNRLRELGFLTESPGDPT